MQMTCRSRARAASFLPTTWAVRPPIPESISSKTCTGTGSLACRLLFSASMKRQVSPPDAIWASGLGGSPGLVAARNSTVSTPCWPQENTPCAVGRPSSRSSRLRLISNLDQGIPRCASSSLAAAASRRAASCRASDRSSACRAISLSSARCSSSRRDLCSSRVWAASISWPQRSANARTSSRLGPYLLLR